MYLLTLVESEISPSNEIKIGFTHLIKLIK